MLHLERLINHTKEIHMVNLAKHLKSSSTHKVLIVLLSCVMASVSHAAHERIYSKIQTDGAQTNADNLKKWLDQLSNDTAPANNDAGASDTTPSKVADTTPLRSAKAHRRDVSEVVNSTGPTAPSVKEDTPREGISLTDGKTNQPAPAKHDDKEYEEVK